MKNTKRIMKIMLIVMTVMPMSANVYARSCTRRVKVVYTNEKIFSQTAESKTYPKKYISQSAQTAETPVYTERSSKTAVSKTTVTEKQTETTTRAVTQAAKTAAASNAGVSGEILNLVNKERAANGLSALTLDADLSAAAQAKAEDMYRKGYFSHTSPTYGSPFDMMKSFGISYRTAGENIAKGQKTPAAVMSAWMNSDGHRKNILGSGFTKLGVGYVNAGGTTYWVHMFAG